jgi:membrane dipeptidase
MTVDQRGIFTSNWEMMQLALKRRNPFCIVLLAGAMTCSALGFTQDTPVSSRARSLQSSALVVDAHEDTPQRFLDENYDIGSTDPKDEEYISLDKARAGNLGAEFFSIWAYPKTNQGHLAKRTLDLIDSVYEQAARHPDRMMMAFSAKDIERAHKEQKLAALMGIEGGHSIENDIRLLRQYYRLGVRYMTLTWSNSNEWADSSGDLDDLSVQHYNGLTEFGKQVVLEMNRLGMIVDVSHVSDKTFWDTIAISKAPVIASHSSARALLDVQRNMSDEMVRAISRNGGVVCLNFFADFLDHDFLKAAESQHLEMLTAVDHYAKERKAADSSVTEEDKERFAREWLDEHKIPRAPLKSLIDHIDHVVKIAGVNHVGLGSDFDGRNFLPEGIDSVADLPKITQSLLDRGYSSEDIKKILGGNLIKLFREVERVSHDM